MTRLLVVDDHDVVRQGLVTSLKTHGYTYIETAATIKESRSKVAAFNPEAMIVETLIEEAMRLAEEMEAAGVGSGEPSVTVK